MMRLTVVAVPEIFLMVVSMTAGNRTPASSSARARTDAMIRGFLTTSRTIFPGSGRCWLNTSRATTA